MGAYALLLLLLHVFALYHVFSRWKASIDGRFDLKQMLAVSDGGLRAKYAFGT